MKTVVLVLALASAVFAVDQSLSNHCEVISGVSPEAVRHFFSNFGYNRHDINLKRFFKCVIERTDLLFEQNELEEDNYLDNSVEVPKQMDREDAYIQKYGKKCYSKVNRQEGDELEKALEVFVCIYSGNGRRKPVVSNEFVNNISESNE